MYLYFTLSELFYYYCCVELTVFMALSNSSTIEETSDMFSRQIAIHIYMIKIFA